MLLPIPAPDRGRHDAITARAQAHPAQSRLLEGIPVGLGPARLRGVIAAAEHGDARCASMTARGQPPKSWSISSSFTERRTPFASRARATSQRSTPFTI